MFKYVIKKCSEGRTLTKQEAKQAMDEMMQGNVCDTQIAGLLSMMRLRGETVDEMIGFALSMRENATSIELQENNLLDTCGTGGDGLSTFNISTATAILVSACNVKVAKHGNRAFSSKSGSADVLEKLRIPVQVSPIEVEETIKNKGLCFLYAPLYYHSMKHVAKARKQLGIKTIFNLLGPLVNPANAKKQMIGVYNPSLAEKMAQTLRELGTERVLFVTGGEGIDECSISTFTSVVELNKGHIKKYQITPESVGIERGNLIDIQATSVDESAMIIEDIFLGKANPSAENIVVLNSAAALFAAEEVESIKEGIDKARKAILSKEAFKQFKSLQTSLGEVEQC